MNLIKRPSLVWFLILSELFVNLAATLFLVVFIEPVFKPIRTFEDIFVLTSELLLGILFLFLAKKLREDSKK